MSVSSEAKAFEGHDAVDRLPLVHVDADDRATGWQSRWLTSRRSALRETVSEHGAVLVRGLGLSTAEEAGAAFRCCTSAPMAEREAFAARQSRAPGVYSSSTWPARQPMCMHHELSYILEPPGLMLFACLTPPSSGGATGVADAARMLDALPAELVERFEHEGRLLTRNYNDEIGASVLDAFGTDDRAAVEDYCAAHAIEWTWQDDGGLSTRQRRSAVVRHPETGRRCWFNQIAFLNQWTLDPDVREFLVEDYGEDGLPFNTRYGEGDPIEEDVVALLNATYDAHTVVEPWQAGDLMLVDNIATAHSREAYQGAREILVGLAEPMRVSS